MPSTQRQKEKSVERKLREQGCDDTSELRVEVVGCG